MAKNLDKTVAIYGAGIAGLSAAHELAKRGWPGRVQRFRRQGGAGRQDVPDDAARPIALELVATEGLDRLNKSAEWS